MAGFELILAAALCLNCTDVQTRATYPANFINLDENLAVIPNMEQQGYVDDESDANNPLNVEKFTKLREWINGRHLRIATLEDFPLSYTEVLPNGTIVGKGVSFELVKFLQDKFNFTYEVIKPENNIIGARSIDFDRSLVKLLNESKADLAAAFLPLISEVRNLIAYSSTILDEGEWIMVMRRPRESATGSGLMAPFEFWVWILILFSLLLVGPIIYFLIILRNKLTGDTSQKPYSLGHCAWFVYGALMKQGSVLSPIADSTRLLFATWWIFITILTSFYTANLTAFLTLSKFTLPFNTVNDILFMNKEFVSVRGSGIEYAIRVTNESLSMLGKMVSNKHALFTKSSNDSWNLIHYVENGGYVFIRDRPAINHMLYADYRYRKTINIKDEKIHCPFAQAKEPFLKKKRTFAYPVGSNLSMLLDAQLMNLVEQGIVKHLSGIGLPNAQICPQDLGGTERQLRNGDLIMTYYIMFAGFTTSMVVFTSELFFRYINSRYQPDNVGKWARHGAGVGRTTNGLSITPSRWWQSNKHSSSERQPLTTNLTPPPPYQSIFNVNASVNPANHDDNNDNGNGNGERWHRAIMGGGGEGISNMAGIFGAGRRLRDPDGPRGVRRFINGRDYMVFRNSNGVSQLVPMRAPSAALFQYSYTE